MNRDFVVSDPTIQQDGRKLTSLLYPILKRVNNGASVDLDDKPWKQKALQYFARQPSVVVQNTLVTPVPRPPLLTQLIETQERGVLLSSLSKGELAELDKLVKDGNAHVCPISNAAFSFSVRNDVSPSVTLANILWRTSKVYWFCNGNSIADKNTSPSHGAS